MLQFVELKQETPLKRGTSKRKQDFKKFMANSLQIKPKSNQVDVLNVEFRFVKFTVR